MVNDNEERTQRPPLPDLWINWSYIKRDGKWRFEEATFYPTRDHRPYTQRRYIPAPLLTPISEKHPPRHQKCFVKRDGFVFTATPCYGMHEPLWVVKTIDGEAPPVSMQDTDEWWID